LYLSAGNNLPSPRSFSTPRHFLWQPPNQLANISFSSSHPYCPAPLSHCRSTFSIIDVWSLPQSLDEPLCHPPLSHQSLLLPPLLPFVDFPPLPPHRLPPSLSLLSHNPVSPPSPLFPPFYNFWLPTSQTRRLSDKELKASPGAYSLTPDPGFFPPIAPLPFLM